MHKISIEGFSFHGLLKDGMMDIFHMLESIKYRYRVDAVGIWNGFIPSIEKDYILKIKRALNERGLVLANLAVDGANVCSDNIEKRETQYAYALKYLDVAARLEAKTVRIDWGVPREVLTEAEEDLIVRRYREYCGIAQREGFLLCAENHAGAARNPGLMKKVFEEIAHPSYRILLHVGSWYCDKEIGDDMILPYTAHTHVMHKVVEERLLDTLRLFKKHSYDGYVGVEQHGGNREYEFVEWQTAALRRGFAELELESGESGESGISGLSDK